VLFVWHIVKRFKTPEKQISGISFPFGFAYDFIRFSKATYLGITLYFPLTIDYDKYKNFKFDGFVKSPISVLRCIPRHCDVG